MAGWPESCDIAPAEVQAAGSSKTTQGQSNPCVFDWSYPTLEDLFTSPTPYANEVIQGGLPPDNEGQGE